jgi:acetyl-CoA carboxylase carboxyl transferase subunit alpha
LPAIMENEPILDFEQPVADLELKIRELEAQKANGEKTDEEEIKSLQTKCDTLKQKLYANLTPWQRVQIARHPKRPYLSDYLPRIFNDFVELHGDRAFSDDAAMLGGLAMLDETAVLVLGHRKGRSLSESMERNFGMPHPEGYRKALRLMKLAERFKMPVLCFIDTAGAYPGIGAEERGQAEAIARNLREMASLTVPIVVTVVGEGGSGGALAVGVGDVLLMLENAWYSVISPEGCAAILFHDATKAQLAAESLKITAPDLKQLGIVDEIIPEPLGGAHKDPDVTAAHLKTALTRHLKNLMSLSTDKLLQSRYEKYRSIGSWQEKKPTSPRQTKKKKS